MHTASNCNLEFRVYSLMCLSSECLNLGRIFKNLDDKRNFFSNHLRAVKANLVFLKIS